MTRAAPVAVERPSWSLPLRFGPSVGAGPDAEVLNDHARKHLQLAPDEGDAGVGRGLAGDGDAALAQDQLLPCWVDDAADLEDDGARPQVSSAALRLPGPSLASVVTRDAPPAPPVVCAQPG